MSRDRFFCGLLILAAANGVEGFVLNSIVTQGWSEALFGLFGVSAVVWVACFAASTLLYGSKSGDGITIPDAALGLGLFLLTIIPFAKFAWLALTVLGFYMICVAPAG